MRRYGPRIPQNAADDHGYPVGQRIRAVRQRHRRGTLPEHYVQALEAIPGWTWSPQGRHSPAPTDPVPLMFAERLQELVDHLDAHGGQFRPSLMSPALVAWVKNQRRAHRAGTMPAACVNLLRQKAPRVLNPRPKSGRRTG